MRYSEEQKKREKETLTREEGEEDSRITIDFPRMNDSDHDQRIARNQIKILLDQFRFFHTNYHILTTSVKDQVNVLYISLTQDSFNLCNIEPVMTSRTMTC